MRSLGAAVVATLAALAVPLAPQPATAQASPVWQADEVTVEALGDTILAVEGFGDVRGRVVLRPSGGGIDVVNEIGLEDYVRGISEVPSSWPPAALQAQAIAARTYALWRLASGRAADPDATSDICATESCQVFRGLAAERADTSGRWAAAVAATTGQVLLHRGAVIPAYYSSSNGGLSWSRGVAYLPEVRDPDDLAASPWARWQSVVGLRAISDLFPGDGELTSVRTTDVVILQRTRPDGTLRDELVSRYTFRQRLNSTLPAPPGVPVPVPSVRFSATTRDGNAVLDGAGYGHLTGMSQYGALGKARRGLSAADIVASYYGGLRPTVLRPEQLPREIRVAVLDSVGVGRVSAVGPVRVSSGSAPSVELASGSWQVRRSGPGVRVDGPRSDPPAAGMAPMPLAAEVAASTPDTLSIVVAAPTRGRLRRPSTDTTLPSSLALATLGVSAALLLHRRRVPRARQIAASEQRFDKL